MFSFVFSRSFAVAYTLVIVVLFAQQCQPRRSREKGRRRMILIKIWLKKDIFAVLALLLLTVANAGSAIADVTVDACVTQKSLTHPSLTVDMQSLYGLASSSSDSSWTQLTPRRFWDC